MSVPKRPFQTFSICLLATLVVFYSCAKIDLYEKVTAIPEHSWESEFIPSFSFTITDTASPYQLYVILRHTERYNYNNIWVNLHTVSPDSTRSTAQYELVLATSDKGWLGSGLDDLYEHRIPLTPLNQQFYFRKAGTYTFSLQHIMREDPLRYVMNAGLRIEKKNP